MPGVRRPCWCCGRLVMRGGAYARHVASHYCRLHGRHHRQLAFNLLHGSPQAVQVGPSSARWQRVFGRELA